MKRYVITFTALTALMGLLLVVNINSGSVHISVTEILNILFLKAQEGSTESNIIWKIRLPRTTMAAILGGALAVSGYLLQTYFRNPIAGPYVLGISSGAKLFVAVLMLAVLQNAQQMTMTAQVMAAFAGSVLAMGIVLVVARKVQDMSMLLVAGIMIGYICQAVTDFFITFANENDIANLTQWSMGSFSGVSLHNVQGAAVIVGVTMVVTMLLVKPIGAYRLGEGYAKSMGINVSLFRVVLILLSSMLSACVTAYVGPISFVGIAVPHISKAFVKTSAPAVAIPATFLSGSVFVMFCDYIARTAFAPVEMSIGTVTAIFGAPVVIYMMIRQRGRR